MNLLVSRAMKKFGDCPGLITESEELSFQQLISRAENTAAAIKNAISGAAVSEVSKPVVAFPAFNRTEDIIRIYAGLTGGFVACPLNRRLSPGQQKEQTDFIKPDLILTKADYIDDSRLTEQVDFSKSKVSTAKPFSYDKLTQRTVLESAATIVFTSGSSGTPKAVVHTLKNHYYNARGALSIHPFGPGDRWLMSLPIFHVSGLSLLFRALRGGGAIAVPAAGENLEQSILRFRPTHLSLVATQLRELLNSPGAAKTLTKCKHILLGGGPADRTLLENCRRLKLNIYKTYGLTETASQVATSTQPLGPVRLLPFRKLQIDESGVIHVGGAVLSPGYFRSEQPAGGIAGPDGFFPTGDLGSMLDGNLKVTGRIDNMFISGGENIYPEEIERALLTIDFPDLEISAAIISGLSSRAYGTRPVALIQLSTGKTENAEESGLLKTADVDKIKQALSKELAGYQIPDAFLLWPGDDQHLRSGIKISRAKVQEYVRKVLGDSLP